MTDYIQGERGLDHILWAVPDLEAGIRQFDGATGVICGNGGSHEGFGTRNALASLGEEIYFEVISTDPAQENFGARADKIGKLTAPEMHTFGIRGSALSEYRDTARELGLAASDPVYMSRIRADGVRIEWTSIYFDDPVWGGMIPFLIDWMGSQHPWETTPKGLEFISFTALHPEPETLQRIYSALGIRVPVQRAVAPGFLLEMNTPKGRTVLI